MYTIHIDIERRKIDVTFCGHINMDELLAYTNEILNIIAQFRGIKVLVLADIKKLDPFSQECLDICINGLIEASHYIKKLAVVYTKVITRMQFDRIICTANLRSGSKITYQLFNSRMDALTYLNE